MRASFCAQAQANPRESGALFTGTIAWELGGRFADLLGGDGEEPRLAAAAAMARQLALVLDRAPAQSHVDTGLSPRELEILAWIAAGRSNKDIARQLVISESTVKTHRERIYQKLGIRTRAGAVDHARKLGVRLPDGNA